MKYERYTIARHCHIANNKLLGLHIQPYHSISIWVNDVKMADVDLSEIVGLTYGQLLNTLRILYGTRKVDIVATLNSGNIIKKDWHVFRNLEIYSSIYTNDTIIEYNRNVNFFA